MKLLTLKHPTLCQIVLYAPALTFFAVLFLGSLLEDPGYVWVLLFLLSAVFSIYYLFRFMFPLIASDMIFSTARAWKRDRLWYPMPGPVRDREALMEVLCRRAQGKSLTPVDRIPAPVIFRRGRSVSWTVFYREIHRITLVYGVDILDEQSFGMILDSARINLRNIPQKEKPLPLMDPSQKSAPTAQAVVLVILADRVSEAVTDRLRGPKSGMGKGTLPCVVDLGTGRCWFDGMREVHMLGAQPKPEKNYALDMVTKLLFPMGLPLGNAGPMLPFPIKDLSPDLSLKDLLLRFQDQDANFLAFLRIKEKWRTRGMKHGQIKMAGGKLYYKHHKRVAEMDCRPMDESGKTLEVTLPDRWCLPRSNRTSVEDRNRIRRGVDAALTAQGIQARFRES